MKCPSCGHTNDGSNRFCEYCGARLDPAMNQEATQVGAVPNLHTDQSYDAPTMFVPADQAPPAPPAQAEPAASSLNCRECGYINQPGDRYCDQCGASLEAPAVAVGVDVAPIATPVPSASEAVTPPDGVPAVQAAEPRLAELTNVAPDEELPTVPIEDQQPFSAPSNESEPVVAATEEPVAAPIIEAEPVAAKEEPFDSPVAEAAPVLIAPEEPRYEDEPVVAASQEPAVDAAPASDTAPTVDAEAVAAERTALEAAIIEQEDNLAMFEQMSARYAGRALPAHIAAGIEETKTSLAEAQAALAAFDQAQAAAQAAAEAAQAAALPDPAEVERLETAIAEHQDNLAMFEQMSARYAGRALPAHIAAGLEESKHALAEAEAELTALLGGAPAAPAAPPIPAAPVNTYDAPTVAAAAPSEPAPVAVAPAEPVAVPAPAVEATPAWAAPTPAAPEPAPAWSAPAAVAPAAPVTPHLVVAGSQVVLNLPTDKQVYVIGREDPISGIYPEVDLTNHGGEGGGVSRQHARLHNTGGNWTLEDLNSTNYSKVNGQKLAPHAPAPVNHGDQLQFGKVVVTLHLR